VDYFASYESAEFLKGLDVVLLVAPLVDFEETVHALSPLEVKGKLIVDMSVLLSHPKAVLLREFGNDPSIDIVTVHAMFGGLNGGKLDQAESTSNEYDSWDSRPVVYDKIRVSNIPRFERFIKVFEQARCKMVEMTSEQHDETIADAEFVTYLTGRLLTDKELLPPTPVISKEYAALNDVAHMTTGGTFDLFFGMFKYNEKAKDHISKLRDNLARIERQLAAKEAYLAASHEMRNTDRQRLLAETKKLLQEVVGSNAVSWNRKGMSNLEGTSEQLETPPK
jgi:arogenate dehydrogenase (NADP+), plant